MQTLKQDIKDIKEKLDLICKTFGIGEFKRPNYIDIGERVRVREEKLRLLKAERNAMKGGDERAETGRK